MLEFIQELYHMNIFKVHSQNRGLNIAKTASVKVTGSPLVYLTFTLIYGGIITHSFSTCKLHLKQSGKVPQPVL